MALPVQSSSYPQKPFRLLPKSPLRHLRRKPSFLAKSQTPSEPQDPAINGPKSTTATEPSSALDGSRKPSSSGLGFGPSSSKNKAAGNSAITKKRRKGQKNRTGERPSPVTRRPPVDKPTFMSEQGGSKWVEQQRIRRIFFLVWSGFGSAILIEGFVLSASGFLPEELDNFFTKYLYPTFTPAVILFFAGAIAFGVSIYRKNEKVEGKK